MPTALPASPSSPRRAAGGGPRALRLLAVALTVVALLLATGCATKTVTTTGANGVVSTQTVPNVHFAQTKFVLHMGLAFGAFHRYIYKPLRTGGFSRGAPGRKGAFVKAAAAGLFVVHELRLAREDALSDNTLRPLANRIDSLTGSIASLGGNLGHGVLNPAGVLSAQGATSALGSASKSLGAGVKDLNANVGG